MKMKRWIVCLLLTVAAGLSTADAQSIEQFKKQLAEELVSEAAPKGARVEVIEHVSPELLARVTPADPATHIRGYRVCIFFDNGQDARAGAMAAKQTFEEQFPDIKLYMVYENPYFRVTVGNCLTIEEAVILKGRLAATFPKAFPKSEELLLQDLL